jgi:release factor glutamine methyltransferase
MPEQKLLDLMSHATALLEQKGIDSPRLNAERMLCSILECTRSDLYLNPERFVTSDVVARFEAMLDRRLADEPLQYILGETEFYGLRIKCDKRALIPRPETEFVVSEAIEYLEQFDRLYILDLACGTGCIGIALAANLPQASIAASDLSEEAISLAKENVLMNNMIARFRFFTGPMFDAVRGESILYDAVVCNPPYVRDGDFDSLERQIRDFEPKRALVSGEDGLDFIRRMIGDAPDMIVPGGFLIFEIGIGQANDVRVLIETSDSLQHIETVKDYSGIDRVVVARRAALQTT